jgi:hypothetical protein
VSVILFISKVSLAMLLVIDTAHQQFPNQRITCIIFDSTTTNPPLSLDVSDFTDVFTMAAYSARYFAFNYRSSDTN